MMRLAVLMSGPRRYAPLVLDRLREKLPMGYTVLVHLWEAEDGAKARDNFTFDVDGLRDRPEVAYLVEQPGYQRSDFPEILGESNSGSPPHNTMGMFLAIMHLCGVLRPQGESFTHVLRIRTDCLIHDWALSSVPEGVNWVADNPALPREWICDHLWLGPIQDFLEVWDFGTRNQLIADYLRARRNPERLLARRARRAGVMIERKFARWVHYSIVYARIVESDPKCLREVVKNRAPESIFSNADTWHVPQACWEHFKSFPVVPDHLAVWNRFKQWWVERLGRGRAQNSGL